MGLLSIFNRFTRRFRKKKKRKTRRRKVGGQDKYSNIARRAILKAASKAGPPPESKSSSRSHKVRAPQGRKLQRRTPAIFIAKQEHIPPKNIIAKRISSGRISPPPQSPNSHPGKKGGRRKKKTRRRKGGAGDKHSSLARQAMCQKSGGIWEDNKCYFINPQEGSGKSRRRLHRRKRR